MHHMLDPDDRDAGRAHLLDEGDQRRAFVLGEAARHLVEQQQRAAWWRARGRARAACGRGASGCRRGGWRRRRGRIARGCPCSAHRRRARAARPPKAAATTRFSNTVMSPNGCGIWNERAMPMRQRRGGGKRVMSAPSNRTRPASGAIVPVMMPNRVVLPAPFGPMMPSASPGFKREVDADRRSRSAPNRFEILSSARMGHGRHCRNGDDGAVNSDAGAIPAHLPTTTRPAPRTAADCHRDRGR